MSDLNVTVVSGRLTRDPELRHTPSGTAVASAGIAVERYRKDAENETSFFDLTIWSGLAELVSAKARKGDKLTVSGRLNQQRWEAEDGSKRSKVEIVVNDIDAEFMYRKADGSDTPERTDGEQTSIATEAPAAAEASDDDIPF